LGVPVSRLSGKNREKTSKFVGSYCKGSRILRGIRPYHEAMNGEVIVFGVEFRNPGI